MNPNIPDTGLPRVVVIGGGFGGLNFIRKLDKQKYQVVLLDKNNYHKFQPLLYQVAMGGLDADSILFSLRKIFYRHKNFCFRIAEVQQLDPSEKCVHTTIGSIAYDYLVIANGTVTNFFGLDSVAENAAEIKTLPRAMALRDQILERLEAAVLADSSEQQSRLMNIVVVGGGPTGVELAGSLAEMKRFILPRDYPELNLEGMQIFLLEGTDKLLQGMSDTASKYSRKYLEDMEVQVITNALVSNYDGHYVHYGDGQTLVADTLIWAAGVKGNPIEGVGAVLKNGRLKTDAFNRVEGYEDVFAIGDIAQVTTEEMPTGHPMLAPVAIQQGRQLAKNFNRLLKKKTWKPFRFCNKGTMATIGRNRAVADIGNFRFKGFFAWLIWSLVHIMSLVGVRDRFIVFMEWFWSYIKYDREHQLILDPWVTRNIILYKEKSGGK